MTACKDSQATSGKKAVSATLAGVLAVGLVPAVALADEAVEVTEEDGITERVGTAAQAFTNGTVKSATVGTPGSAMSAPADLKAISLTADGKAQVAIPLVVTTEVSADVTVAEFDASTKTVTMKDGYKVEYFAADSEGKPTGAAIASVVNPGKYVSVVTAVSGPYAGGSIALPFTVKPATLDTPTVYEVNPSDPADVSDEKFMYTGSPLNLGIAVTTGSGATPLKQGVDYTVKYLPDGANVGDAGLSSIVNAGTYQAVVTGLGIYAGEEVTIEEVPVASFDLSKADYNNKLTIATTSSVAPTVPQSVVSSDADYAGTELNPSLVKLALTGTVWGNNRAYSLTASPASAQDEDNPNIISTGTVPYDKVGALASFQYDGIAMPSTITVNLAEGESFDPALIKAFNGGTELDAGVLKFRYSKNGAAFIDVNADKADTYKTAGTYVVNVSVNTAKADGTNFAVGGSATTTVTVVTGSIDLDAKAYVTYNDDTTKTPFTSLTLPYKNGGYVQGLFEVGVVVPAGSPGVTTTKTITDEDGAAVTGALTNAGTYTIKVGAPGYDLSGTDTVTVTIAPIDLKSANVEIEGLSEKFGCDSYISVGDALSGFGVDYFTGEKQANGDPETKAVSSFPTNVTVAWQKWDEDASKWVTASGNAVAGKYRVAITPNSADALKNFEFDSDEGTFIELPAVDEGDFLFADVVPGTWYFDPIAEAAQPKAKDPTGTPATPPYMNGYAGANLFGPNDAITRGQVACVLYNMAGGDALGFIPSYTENYGVDTGFSDVDGKMYYAKAIAWAKSTGVVNGFAGTDQFGPDDNITREQFAAMLANYAQKRGATLPSDVDGILAGISDGPSTSDWAKASVAWAVENEVMGRGGFVNPFGTASRAEVAAMAVNYQPRA